MKEQEIYRLFVQKGNMEMVVSLENICHADMEFLEYAKDKNGTINGIVVACDLGHGYGFDYGKETVTLYPQQVHRFTHEYTDTSDGTWEKGSYDVTVRLLLYEDASEEYWSYCSHSS